MPAFDVLTFDCYGTLIDWESGISTAFRQAAAADGFDLQRAHILAAYARIEPAIQAGEYRSYREVLTAAAVEVGNELGWQIGGEAAAFLPDSLPSWPPFEDTNRALEILAAQGVSLGILSNVDDDLLAGTCGHFTVEFDTLVTAQQVRSYKPAHGHFRRAAGIVGDRRWFHVAQSYFHDIEPAYDLGIPSVWVNRKHEQPTGEARPTAEVRDLLGLVEWLET